MRDIHVVIFRGFNNWVAQCLEFDIAAQSPTLEDLPIRLSLVLEAEIEYCKDRDLQPFDRLPESPARYWAMWRGSGVVEVAGAWNDVPAHLFLRSAEIDRGVLDS